MTKRRSLANLRAFQLFEAVARHRSLTRAGDELGITQSAVSHQLRNLANALGHPLVERRGRSIVLSAAGSRLAAALHSAFDIIEEQAEAFQSSRTVIRLGLYSSFAVPWLIERLPDFLHRYPDIDLRLVMLYDPHEVTVRLADVFVSSEPAQPGYWTSRLFPERLIPVAHPESQPAYCDTTRLISAEVEPGIAGRAWEAFAALNDLDLRTIQGRGLLCCSHYILALEMVRRGLGVALLPDFMVDDDLAAGRLLRLPGSGLPTGQTYDVQVAFERRHEEGIVAVIAWLRRLTERHLDHPGIAERHRGTPQA